MANSSNKNDNQRAREIEDAKREFRERAQKVKDISIVDYLHTIGYKETHVNGRKKEHYYFDLTNSNKKTGETHVDSDLNKFFVFDGTRRRGDIIDLVQMLDNCDYIEAVNKLSGSSTSISTIKISSVKRTAQTETKNSSNVTTLSDDSKINVLVDYAKRRYISADTLKRSEILFLSQEIVKDNETKHFFFLGLKNDSEGYSIRNKAMKGMRGTMDITTIEKQPGHPFVVVEGMFEYLSVLEATQNFDLNFIILNSTVNAHKAVEKLNRISVTVNNPNALILLNNDKPGQDAAKEILAGCPTKNLVNDFPRRGEDLNFTLKLNEGVAEVINLINRVFIQHETGVAVNNPILITNNANNMTTQNTAAEQQSEQSQTMKNMEFAMKMLGLLPQWEKVKQQFQAWTDDPHTQGKKSFTVNDAIFKRTGNYQKPESTEQVISTDMVADLSLNFNKRDDKVYFNSYTATLKNSIANSISKPVTKSNTYDVFLKKDEMVNNVTVKEGLNLLDGRSVKIENNTWAKMILDETAYDAKTGKHVINEYEFDLQRAIDNNKNIDLSKTPAEQLDKAIKLLEKGDYAFVNAVIDDKPVVVFLASDAQYKQVTAHNQNLYEHLTAAQKTEIAQRIENKQNQSQDQNPEQKTGISR